MALTRIQFVSPLWKFVMVWATYYVHYTNLLHQKLSYTANREKILEGQNIGQLLLTKQMVRIFWQI